MIILNMEQGSPDWFAARLGVVTASELSNIISPIELKPSKQAVAYRHRLLAEYLTGKPAEFYESDWMRRGKEIEEEARDYYAMLTDQDVSQVGFVYKDDTQLIGCSPDGVIFNEDGQIAKGLEIKCLSPWKHVGQLLSGHLPRDFILQVQGSMWVTGLKTWDFLSYHPDMKSVLLTVKRDEKIIAALSAAVTEFIEEMLRERTLLTGDTTLALEASLRVAR